MRLENNYIFLSKEIQKSGGNDNKNNTVVLGMGFNSVFSRLFGNIHRSQQQSNLLRTVFTVDVDDNTCSALITTYVVEKNAYLNLTVNAPTQAKAVKMLEAIHNQIASSKELEKNYTIIISYDAISEYYCNKIYPKINHMERLLRRLCFNVYILNFGRSYYTATIDSNIQDKAKKIIRSNKDNVRLQKFFYSLDFGDIETMLFEPHWTDVEERRRTELLSTMDLSSLTDSELRQAFEKCRPASDFERLFSDKLQDIDTQGMIGQVHDYRTNVAHSKFFYREDYLSCNSVLNKLIKSIEKAIAITEEKDFVEKNWGKVIEALGPALKALAEYTQKAMTQAAPFLEWLGRTAQKYWKLFSEDETQFQDDTDNGADEIEQNT